MKEYKYRHELKFKISNSAAEVLKQKLSLILKKDKNAYYSDGSYLIKRNIEYESIITMMNL